MALFGLGSKEKKERPLPVQRVKELLDRGFTEVEIIDILRKEGYSVDEIDKALEEALRERVLKPLQTQVQLSTTQPPTAQTQPLISTSQIQTQPLPAPPIQTQTIPKEIQSEKTEIKETKKEEEFVYVSVEEFVDMLLKERMKELNKRLMEFSEKQREIEETIASLQTKLEDFYKTKSEEYEKILAEIRSLKDAINDQATKIEALSKTIKEMLPSLIESVRLLGEIVQKVK